MVDIDKVPFTVLAEYQLFGEDTHGGVIDAEEFMASVMRSAVREKYDIEFYRTVGIFPGIWGLQLVVFEVTIQMPLYTSIKAQKKYVKKVLNKIVHDTDVDVRWVNRAS